MKKITLCLPKFSKIKRSSGDHCHYTQNITAHLLLAPSGGSGVQRWMYFAKHLKALGWEPIVISVAPNVAAYPVLDTSLALEVENITVIRTASREPLRWYQRWSGSSVLPQGAVPRKNLLQKLAAFVRGNFFLPDARKGGCLLLFEQ